jgi:transglutaminase-like putative cysteine protease
MIQPPPFLLALGVLLWGAASDRLALAAAAALLVEAPRVLRQRFDLTPRDLERAADLTALALAATAVLLFAQSRHLSTAMLQVLSWLPLLLLGLMLAQRFSTAGALPFSALFWSLRRRAHPPPRTLTLDYPYFGACLIAASAANVRAHWYFAVVVALSLYALLPVAPRGRRRSRWLAAVSAAAVVAFGAQAGLSSAQAAIQQLVFDWIDEHWRAQIDPYRTRTALGDIGVLKASDRILMRVSAEGQPPALLRSASYPNFSGGVWSAAAATLPFIPVAPVPIAPGGADWTLTEGTGPKVQLWTWLDAESTVLPLPLGTYRLEGLNVAGVERNALGTVRVEQGPDSLGFSAHVDPQARTDAAPGPADLKIIAALEPMLETVAREIGLHNAEAAQSARAIEAFFASHYTYSLQLGDGRGAARSLRQFLLEDRRGHCEYFATATVLLLRHAGVPARYATGFSVQEFSELEQRYVVRARHAHAWALAWIDGRWEAIDTTPPDWSAQEDARASPLQPVYDVLSWLRFRFAVWSAQAGGKTEAPATLLWLLPPLVLYLGWRLYRRRHVPGPGRTTSRLRGGAAQPLPALQAVLDRLAARGLMRPAERTLLGWARELPLPDPHARELLVTLILDYYRIRFDPRPTPADARAAVETQARRVLALLER